jgi:hypothetical protein
VGRVVQPDRIDGPGHALDQAGEAAVPLPHLGQQDG